MDPFDGVIVWGAFGLAAWLAAAAAVGEGLWWLGACSRRRPGAAPAQSAADGDVDEAA